MRHFPDDAVERDLTRFYEQESKLQAIEDRANEIYGRELAYYIDDMTVDFIEEQYDDLPEMLSLLFFGLMKGDKEAQAKAHHELHAAFSKFADNWAIEQAKQEVTTP